MEYAEKLKVMANVLEKSKKVNSLNKRDEMECNALANSLLDIEESSKKIIEELLPKLVSIDVSEESIEDVLLDIGEELRHILYHVKDSKFYEYLND